jgi:anti-sigma factor RsiW
MGERRGAHLGAALSAYIDGQLSDRERARAEEHLATCALCRNELASLRYTLALLRELPPAVPRRSFALPAQATSPLPRWMLLLSPARLRLATAVAGLVLMAVVVADLFSIFPMAPAPATLQAKQAMPAGARGPAAPEGPAGPAGAPAPTAAPSGANDTSTTKGAAPLPAPASTPAPAATPSAAPAPALARPEVAGTPTPAPVSGARSQAPAASPAPAATASVEPQAVVAAQQPTVAPPATPLTYAWPVRQLELALLGVVTALVGLLLFATWRRIRVR